VTRLQGCGILTVSLLAASLAFAGVTEYHHISPPPKRFADADDFGKVRQGKQIYQSHCASCHGRNLQGQPLWQMKDEYLGRRAPALDQTGHVWTQSDDDFFAAASHTHLAAQDVLAVMSFIKAHWGVGLRVAQATQNPGKAGMPNVTGDWSLPPDCPSEEQRVRVKSSSTAPRR
jgi:mono/diheme cytochrome c family protein